MAKNKHRKTVLDIMMSPEKINLSRHDLDFVLLEPIWIKNRTGLYMMPDLIFGTNNYAIPVEVKGTYTHRDKAIKQLKSGKEFINEVLDRYSTNGIIVYYATGNVLDVEVLD